MQMGLVHNYGGLLTARWFLGLTEAGLFPGVNYYLSCWYRRSEFGIRAAIFFSAAAVAGSFGGLLAAAIANMDGVGGSKLCCSFQTCVSLTQGLRVSSLDVQALSCRVSHRDQLEHPTYPCYTSLS